MQKRKRIVPVIGTLVLLFCLLLTGCNISVGTQTQMSIDSSFAGYRLITCTVEQSSDTANAVAWLDGYLAEGGCPAAMSYTRLDDENGRAVYQFRMDFSSLEDYYNQVVAVLGRDVVIQLEMPDGVMSSGIRYSEDFTSAELVQWAINALVSSGTLSENQSSGLFNLTGNTFLYNGVEQDCWGDAITVDSLRANSLDSVLVSTVLRGDGAFVREITYVFPYDFYHEKPAEIQAEFSKFVPEGAEAQWNDDSASLLVRFSAPDVASLAALTNTATGAAGNGIATSQAGGEHLLSYRLTYEETLDLSGLLYNTDALQYSCRFSLEDGSRIMEAARNGEGIWFENGDCTEDANTFYEPVHYTLTMEKVYPLQDISMTLSHTDMDRFERKMYLEFGQETPADILDGFFAYFEGQATEGVELTRGSADSGNVTAVFRMAGSAEAVSAASAALLGGSDISVVPEKTGFAKEVRSYVETIDLSNFQNTIGYYGNVKLYLEMSEREKLIGCRLYGDTDGFEVRSDYTGEGKWSAASLPAQPYEIGAYASVEYAVYYQNTALLICGILAIVLGIVAVIVASLFIAYKVCRAKGITTDDPGTFVRTLLEKAWKWLQAFAASVVYSIKNLDALGLPPGARKEIAVYFWGSKVPLVLLLVGALVSWICGTAPVFPVFALAALAALLFFRFRDKSQVEQQIDACIAQNAATIREQDLRRLGFDSSQVSLIEPVQLKGPHDFVDKALQRQPHDTDLTYAVRCMVQHIKDWLHYRSRQIYRQGKDGIIRYPLVQMTAYYFSEEQVCCYIVVYDLIAGQQLRNLTKEYFYQDVNGLKIGEKLLDIRLEKGSIQVPMGAFSLSSRSGKNEKVMIAASDTSIRDSLSGMEQLLRNKKMQQTTSEAHI